MVGEAYHGSITAGDIHIPYERSYANAAACTGASGFVAGDVGRLALQEDNNTLWILTATTPNWVQVGVLIAAGDVTYMPAVGADWDGDAYPGDLDDALDQLTERVDDLEGAGGGSYGRTLIDSATPSETNAVTFTTTATASACGDAIAAPAPSAGSPACFRQTARTGTTVTGHPSRHSRNASRTKRPAAPSVARTHL